MLPENITAIVARNETWTGKVATEPYEAGWAREAIIFVRTLKPSVGRMPLAYVEISPDGMHWMREGGTLEVPGEKNRIAAARVGQFGNWLRLVAEFDEDAKAIVLVTIHLKA